MQDVKVIFAQNLISLRKQMKLTQIELAEKINYSDKAVSKWERGESIPDVTVLMTIASLFGVTLDFLVTEHAEPEVVAEQTSYAKAVKKRNRLLVAAITFLRLRLWKPSCSRRFSRFSVPLAKIFCIVTYTPSPRRR